MYECHITLDKKYLDILLVEELAIENGWKTSEIDRDPFLEDRVYFYLTKHGADFEELKSQMRGISSFLEWFGIKILRQKIEKIVFDTSIGDEILV